MRPTFRTVDSFSTRSSYRFLPFRFIELDDQVVLVNLVGEHELVARHDFQVFVDHRLVPESRTYENLKAKHFLEDTASDTAVRLLATKLRTKYQFLEGFTKLHIFVVTLRCDHTCQYCQVSRVTAEKSRYDMSPESADKSLDLVFRAPARRIKIEFQGGEPLLNFSLIRYVVREAKRRNDSLASDFRKVIEFVVTTNLSLVDDEILEFCKEHEIFISTSLDGPAYLHNANRPRPGGDAYERTIAGIERTRSVLGWDGVSALMTTTRLSLSHPEEIVDEYVNRGFGYIFVRPISPYGFAIKTKRITGYERSEFVEFYRRALDRVIERNRNGERIVEIYAQILLTKMLTPYPTGYVDLQSPAGAGIGAVVYNYDGDVYASDEARMLAEMGDKTFRLGSVHTDSYEEIFGGALMRKLVEDSITDAIPGCADCALQPYCGSDPVENHATQGDTVGYRPTSEFCERNMGIIKHLLRLLHGPDAFTRNLLQSWATGVPLDQPVLADA